jgi:hypothetical protein
MTGVAGPGAESKLAKPLTLATMSLGFGLASMNSMSR